MITVGANYFLYGHALKWTNDIGFGLTEVSPTFASSGTGWRADSAGNAGQIVFRSQLQLYF